MSNVSQIELELEEARNQLHRTLGELNRKAAASGSDILATEQIRRYPVPSLCGALALGFAAGGAPAPAMLLGLLAIGGTLVVAPDNECGVNGVGNGAV